MPMTFTDDLVSHRLVECKLATSGIPQEQRERLATYVEDEYSDHVEAWEIRTGRPWNTMTREEASALIAVRPEMMRNPGVLSRLVSK